MTVADQDGSARQRNSITWIDDNSQEYQATRISQYNDLSTSSSTGNNNNVFPAASSASSTTPIGMMRQQRSETTIPPRHAFQLRMKGLVNSLVSSSSELPHSTEQQDSQRNNNSENMAATPIRHENTRHIGANNRNESNRDHTGSNRTVNRDDEDDEAIDQETDFQLDLLNLWGRSYVQQSFPFFLKSVIASILIGCLVGAFTLCFITLTYCYGVTSNHPFMLPTGLLDKNTSFLVVSVIGGIIIGFINLMHLILIKDPLFNSAIPNVFHRLSLCFVTPYQQRIRWIVSDILSALASLVAIMIGAPIGPEAVLVIMSCLVATIFSYFVLRFQTSNMQDDDGRDHDSRRRRNKLENQRIEALWIHASIASAMSSLAYIIAFIITKGVDNAWSSPVLLLGAIIVHEMSVVSRPNTLTIDAHLQHNRYRELKRRRRRRGNEENDVDDDHDYHVGSFAAPFVTSNRVTIAPTTHYGLDPPQTLPTSEQEVASTSPRRFQLHPNDHDYIEGLTVQLISTAFAIATIRLLMDVGEWSSLIRNNHEIMVSGISQGNFLGEAVESARTISEGFNDAMISDSWHLTLAIAMGIVCGLFSSILIGLIGLLHFMRRILYHYSMRRCITKYLFVFLWPTITLVLLEILRTFTGRISSSGMGISLLERISETNSQNRSYSHLTSQNVSLDSIMDTASSTPLDFDFGCLLVLSRGLGVALALGFGSFIGGIVFPLYIIGIGVGVMLGSLFNIPLLLSIPCCMAGCSVSVCPAPFTIVLSTIVLLSCSVKMAGPLFVTALSAWMVTGGLGIIRMIEKKRIKLYQAYALSQADINVDDLHRGFLRNDFYYESSSGLSNFSDDEYLRDIRSAIFGNT